MKRQTAFYLEMELLKEFRKQCVDEGVKYSKVVGELIQKWLDEK
jgi:hypothetical protein